MLHLTDESPTIRFTADQLEVILRMIGDDWRPEQDYRAYIGSEDARAAAMVRAYHRTKVLGFVQDCLANTPHLRPELVARLPWLSLFL
jgi:hypothetical protein